MTNSILPPSATSVATDTTKLSDPVMDTLVSSYNRLDSIINVLKNKSKTQISKIENKLIEDALKKEKIKIDSIKERAFKYFKFDYFIRFRYPIQIYLGVFTAISLAGLEITSKFQFGKNLINGIFKNEVNKLNTKIYASVILALTGSLLFKLYQYTQNIYFKDNPKAKEALDAYEKAERERNNAKS